MSGNRPIVRSWRQMVLEADPDFHEESNRPIAYEMSNGRVFRDWPTSGAYAQDVVQDVSGNAEMLKADGTSFMLKADGTSTMKKAN